METKECEGYDFQVKNNKHLQLHSLVSIDFEQLNYSYYLFEWARKRGEEAV